MIRTVGLFFVGGGLGTLFGWVLGFRTGEQEAERRHRMARRIEREHRQ